MDKQDISDFDAVSDLGRQSPDPVTLVVEPAIEDNSHTEISVQAIEIEPP